MQQHETLQPLQLLLVYDDHLIPAYPILILYLKFDLPQQLIIGTVLRTMNDFWYLLVIVLID